MYEMAIAQKESAEAYNNLGAIYKEKDNMVKLVNISGLHHELSSC